ncbi:MULTISPECIES: DUF255 domain-containing protein [unclassified Guyparkeria]|uniref:DUF255 domain-containing protein n=1 Tax=unclassified Guyparkeria TaxID=2626246 RepID=UPI0007338B5C|nr:MULTISPECIES: DUF255 domain-containing protein [unclassified Guyparkeria]KTG16909.1 hypothetical protein AUR63_02325 [Guyparkeria sp. XI15]OAE85943.1 hypothetical protein AWR35_02325 [Guyparkeria sp. WRN-7]
MRMLRPPSLSRRFPVWLAGLCCLAAVGLGDPAAAENRLADTASDYLRDHADNPVDWYPWGEAALERARREDKPIFVSVGYSTCYWCHVAERELYEDPAIAARMNAGFVNIKVDREQRPDLDRVLMQATEALGGGGGWPNNVFLTPELEPFFAGSYFPPEPLPGRESFPQILERLSAQWRSDREPLVERAERIAAALRAQSGASGIDPARLDPLAWREQAVAALSETFDPLVGGFAPAGQSSRFPQSPKLSLLLSAAEAGDDSAAEMLDLTLAAMSIGALFDHVGGGFHRYTVDPQWQVPHFEKMLLDNAQLIGLYARAGNRLEQPWYARVAGRSIDYLERRLRAEAAGLYTAESASLDGIEGKSYVFTSEEIRSVLGERADVFLDWHELVPLPESRIDHELPDGGVVNLRPGRALEALDGNQLAAAMTGLEGDYAALLDHRQARGQPSRDRKRVAEFNALAGLGLLAAAQPLDRGDAAGRAVAVGEWLWDTLWDERAGQLSRQAYAGQVSGEAFLADYAATGRLMLALYGSQHELKWLFRAQRIANAIEARFVGEAGRLHERALGEEAAALPITPPLLGDEVGPSGHSLAVVFLLDIGQVMDAPLRQRRAVAALAGFAGEVTADPSAWGWLVGELARPSRAAAVERFAAELAAPEPAGPGASRDHVAVDAQRVEDGEAIEVRLAIDPGFHINANPASADYLVPTRVTAVDGEIGAIDYPAGKPFRAAFATEAIDVYEGELTLRAPVAGDVPTRLRIEIQACDDEVCLAPDTVEVPVGR